jgi:protein phosphatase
MTDLAGSTLRLLRQNGRQSSPDPRSRRDPATSAEVYGATDVGLVRDRNEDQFLVARLARALDVEQSSIAIDKNAHEAGCPQGRLLMVADGMGGVPGGDVASAVAIDAMTGYAFAMMPWIQAAGYSQPDLLSEGLRQALHDCEARMHRVARRKGLDENMGTTLTIAYVTWPVLHVVHVGDSRCYLFRGGELSRLTRDHTIAQELVDRRALTERQAAQSRFSSMLTNAVGGSHEAVVDLHRLELSEGDELLLCSDGLSTLVPDRQLHDLMARGGSVRDRVTALIEAAKGAGGDDNITAVLAHF